MSLVETFEVGRLRCHLLDAGTLRLDGGAMFGVVPRPLWERRAPPDDRNRIELAMRTLLVEHDEGPVLVDTGLGNKESEKFRSIYGVDNGSKVGATRLDDALAEAGISAGDIRWVINTHLHFDHAGGNTVLREGEDVPVPAFEGATYVVQRAELAFATHPNERTAGSYLPHNFEPVTAAGRWRLLDGVETIVPGLSSLPTPGHTPAHQSVLVRDGGDTLCFVADLIPTTAHLPLAWIMGYDLEPMVTLANKKALLNRAVEEGWTLAFEHDPRIGRARVEAGEKGVRLVESA